MNVMAGHSLFIRVSRMTEMAAFVNEDNPVVPVKKEETRIEGKIIKISEEGWGFISSKDLKFTRIFFHWSSLKQNTLKFPELKMGMKVSFVVTEIPDKGFRAIKIEVLK